MGSLYDKTSNTLLRVIRKCEDGDPCLILGYTIIKMFSSHVYSHMRARTHMSDGSQGHPMWPEASGPLRRRDLVTSG